MEELAKIVSFEEFDKLKEKLGTIVCTSGGFDPIHSGHISCLQESKQYANTLVVIVNGDNFLKDKKGKPFMNLSERCSIVSSIKNVDYVIPFEIKNDSTVIKALEKIKPNFFTKGGDRHDKKTIAEWDICEKLNIKIITNVGNEKKQTSSSKYLNAWTS
ncbi:adenylyltransferase/cytidyltransferase family protein [Poseidonibacter lekithochrous]|uniref:adenylyltransferase/cytidyltransferase family protein n=1 Tax=Poseidonibacter TaxID=2321187 RepID=UPI001C08C056|nr:MULTISPECIES: adenylyltransferase/cytidyltransferase family protein [Poseidonibacter]MBU3013691.1 adenylyltransferase/cytidyltransferase family protein [Poseidonibacter lekithochrous]MDO6826988.1 adenylyltransferase/cytidyltransferase family protein [Poseidonibacter sp. 1_MG-2023]